MHPKAFLQVFMAAAFLVAQPSDGMKQEASKRHQALIQEGYNLTHGFSFGQKQRSKPIHLEILIPASESEHRLNFWLMTQSGEASVQFTGETGKTVFSWSGNHGDLVLSRRLPVGKYVLEIDSSRADGGVAEFGVQGALMQVCALDSERTKECPASPEAGFYWPYLLFIPKNFKAVYLLVVPNNTGFAAEDLGLLRADGACEVQQQSTLAERLGCPLLVPLFPRPGVGEEDNLYLHALSKGSLLTERKEWKRVDLQLLGMIQDARARLEKEGREITSKVLLSGFSASGSFVNRFTLLHPESVLAVACGSPGGWPVAPVDALDGEKLPYPVGMADLEMLSGQYTDRKALKAVAWFFYMGNRDENDAVPFRDSYSKTDEELIFRRFGPTPVSRWKQAERLYTGQGLAASFMLYPGVAHEVTATMQGDIARFFEARLRTCSLAR
jgi:hypothetical protein